MPGERPPTMTGDLQPCPAASGPGRPPQLPHKDRSPAGRSTQGSGEAQRGRAKEVEPRVALPRTQAPNGPPGKGGGPRAPSERSCPQARPWLPARVDGGPPQLYGLSITSLRVKPTLDETPQGPPCEARGDPEAEAPQGQGTGARPQPGLPRAEARPAAKALGSQRCFQETTSSFTSTNHTSLTSAPGPPPPRAPQTSGASPGGPGSYPEFQASGANPWLPAAENFPGANLGISPAEPEPFAEGSRPGSPRGTPFPYPFPTRAPAGASTQPFPADTAGQAYSGTLVFAFQQPAGPWPEAALGARPTYPLPSRPGPPPLPCFPSQPGSLGAPGDPGAPSPTGAAHSAPSPYPESLHKSLTKVLPEGPPSAHDGMGSPGGPPNPLSQRHFAGQTYGANGVGGSPGPLDTELAAPGPPPPGLPPLWDSTAAPYPTPALGPPGTARAALFESQQPCLPHSAPAPWPPAPPAAGPGPRRVEALSQLPFAGAAPEWQAGSPGALGAVGQAPGPGEPGVVRGSPSQQGSAAGLYPYGGLDPRPQPLFFGAQPSPRGGAGLPPPGALGASPSRSPLPSPAPNTTASSACSSLSPLSSSPANPGSEDSQLAALGPAGFFHPPAHAQDAGSPFPSPEPPRALPAHYRPGPEAFPPSAGGLGAEGAFEPLDEAPFPSQGPGPDAGLRSPPPEPPAYSAHHFPLSSASLDQLDVLLTCRQCDHNYGSLAAFLAHRRFCRPARAGDGAPQPPAPAPGPLGLSHPAPLLLPGGVQAGGKADPPRAAFVPGLAATPFPLPAPDLDLEDEAKLDSLITEALKGMECQSDNPEIDSSFIDVFADEEPPGPREPGAGQPHTRPAETPAQSPPPPAPAGAATQEPADGGCPPSRPQTRSLGPAPAGADTGGLVRQQRRGKRVSLSRKELDGPQGTCRAPCPRPRRRQSAGRPPPRARDLRAQAKGPADPDGGVPGAPCLPAETRRSRRPRVPPRKDPRRRRAPGGTWSKELIHKIVQQKNKLSRMQGPRGPPAAGWAWASESEEDEGPRQPAPGLRGRPRPGRRRWRQKRKGEDATRAPRSPGAGEAPREGGPTWTDLPAATPRPLPQAPADAETPEEDHPPSGFPLEAGKPQLAAQTPPAAARPREVPCSCPAVCGSQSPGSPGPAERGRDDATASRGGGDPLSAPACAKPPTAGSPARQPGGSLAPVAGAAAAACPSPTALFLKNPDLGCDSALLSRDPAGAPAATGEPQPSGTAPGELFLKPKDLEDCFPADLCSKPPAVGSSHGGRDALGTLGPAPPKNSPFAAEVDAGKAQSPLTLESTSLFSGLPEDEFDPPLYDSLSAAGDTHVPLACAGPAPGRPPMSPLYPPFVLLEDVCPVPPGPFPDPPSGKAVSKQCPREGEGPGPGPPCPPSLPAPGRACGVTFTSNLSEDELEIKRLVTELESQLQRTEGSPRAPAPPALLATPPCGDPLPAADPTGLGGSGPHPEGMGTAVATREGAPEAPQPQGRCPAPRPAEAAPPHGAPATHLQTLQEARVPKTEGDSGGPPDLCLPNPNEQRGPLPEAGCPGHELSFPEVGEAGRTREGGQSPSLPCEQGGGCPPEPLGAQGPCPGSPACVAPALGRRADGDAALDAILPRGTGHRLASRGRSEDGGPEGAGLPHPRAEGTGCAPAGASLPAALLGGEAPSQPAPCPPGAPGVSTGWRPQGAPSGSLRPLQDPGDVWCSQGPPPSATRGPEQRAPPGRGEDSAEGGSPARVQVAAVPAVARCKLGPKADRRLGSPGQREKPRARGKAHRQNPGAPCQPATPSARPDARRAGRATGTCRLDGGGAALGLWKRARPGLASAPAGHHSLVLALPEAHTQRGPQDRAPTRGAGPDLDLQPPGNTESPAPPAADPGPHTPAPTPLGLEPPPSAPGGLLPEPPCRDPPSPPCLPSWAPAWVPLGGAGCAPAPTGAGAGEPPAELTPHPARHCEPPLLRAKSAPAPSKQGLGVLSATTHAGHSPGGSTLGTLEGSPLRTPTCASCPPPGGHDPPRLTTQAAGPPSVPTQDDREADGGMWVPDPRCRGAPPHPGPGGEPEDPPSSPGSHGEDTVVTAAPVGPAALEASGPDPHTCPESEIGSGSETQGDPGTPEARHHGATQAPGAGTQGPTAGRAPTGRCPAVATSPSSSVRDLRSSSPQKDPRQRPRGSKRKLEPKERGPPQERALAGLPVTCEVCSASFRSRPGLNRHKARKHRPPRATTPPPSPTARPANRPLETATQARPAPAEETPGQLLLGHTSGPPPGRDTTGSKTTGSKAVLGPEARRDQKGPEGTRRGQKGPGSPLQPPQPPGPMEQPQAVRVSAPQPGRPGQPDTDKPHPKGTAAGESQRRRRAPSASPQNSEGRASTRAANPGARRFRAGAAPRSPSVAAASDPAPRSRCLSPEEDPEATGPGALGEAADGAPGALRAEEAPQDRDQGLRAGRVERRPLGRKGAGARRRGPRGTGPPASCKGPPAQDRRGAGPGQASQQGAPGPAETETETAGPEAGGVPGPQGPVADGPGQGDPARPCDDQLSLSQLFPPGGRFTRKKGRRVYGERGKRPKRPPPAPPSGQPGPSPPSTRLPTDLSDSGSLCLSPEGPWGDEDLALTESFLLDGLLGSRAPGTDPCAPGLGLWALEPAPGAGPGEEDGQSEAIPELHMVPAAWRGLGLGAPAEDTGSSRGDASPEPPDLERERYDAALPGDASLDTPPAPLELQGPCGDLARLPGRGLLDSRAVANPQGPRSQKTGEAAGAARAGGRKAYKCRVCFQRFRGLGALDLHRLAHSPSPPPACYMCAQRRFRSRQLLREHLQERHAQGRAGPWVCGMCLREVADVWMYNQHLREHATRFARRGQARQAVGRLPGALLLDSLVEPVTKPHGARHAGDGGSGSPGEPLEPDKAAGEDGPPETATATAKPRPPTPSASPAGCWPPSGLASSHSPAAPTSSSTAGTASAKASPSPSPEPWARGEPPLHAHAAPVHADCRDPSRDCHHCGKRFPKPFKLQRHLAVHGPQRVYLCPRCPRVYPELPELRAHLGAAHGVQEQEPPHTPLYACELCANVMHVISRAFACSSCNYTFAKKEQFDRHMHKHLRARQPPSALRGARRPRAPEGTPPSKRRKLAAPRSAPAPAVPRLGPHAAPSSSPERLLGPGGHPARGHGPPSDGQAPPPPAPSPLAGGRGGGRLDGGLEMPEGALSGSPGPRGQQAPPAGKRAPLPLSGKPGASGTGGKCAPARSSGDPSLIQRDKQASPGHTGAPSHKGSAAKPGASQRPPKDRSAASAPSRPPKLPAQPKKPQGLRSPAPGELALSAEDRTKPTAPKAKSRPSPQGSGGPRPSSKTGGGSQPQPASGRLQSETATTPAKPAPTPDKPLPRAQARGGSKGPREACGQGPQGCPGPKETGTSSEKRRKSQAPALTRREGKGGSGRIPPAPDKPPRAPRKQPTPSRVLLAKPRPSSLDCKPRPQASEPRKGTPGLHRKEAPGKAFAQARPLPRSPKRGRAVHGAEASEPRDHRTAESQSDLLSQLFGQRLTSFKIPLKKDSSE